MCLVIAAALALLSQEVEKRRFQELEGRFAAAPEGEKLKVALELIDQMRFPGVEIPRLQRYSRVTLELARRASDHLAEGFAWRTLAYCHFKNGDYQNALRHYFQARESFASIPAWSQIGHMNSEIGNIFLYCYSAGSQALGYYEKALGNYSRAGDIYNQVKCANLMGEVHRIFGRYEEAARFYIQALERSQEGESPLIRRKRAVITTNLSDIYFLLEDLPQSRQYLQKAETIYRQEKLYIETASILTRRGDMARREGNLEDALADYTQALAIRRKWFTDHPEIAAELRKIADTHSLAGNAAKADRFFSEALAISRAVSDLPGAARTLLGIGIHMKRQDLHREALATFLQSLEIAQKNGLLKEVQEAAREVAAMKARDGEGKEELRYRKIADEAAARFQSPVISARVMKILMRYENEEQLRRLRANRRRIALVLVFSLALAVVTTLLFIVRHRRTRKALRSNLERLQERETQLAQLKRRVEELENPAVQERYRNSKLSWEQEQSLLRRLIAAMETEELYVDPDLDLLSLAKKMGVNRTYLSQVINHSTGKSFTDFINSFRVEAAKRLIDSMDRRETSFLDVCFDAGFNTKTAFNRAFKKMTGQTPSEYLKKSKG